MKIRELFESSSAKKKKIAELILKLHNIHIEMETAYTSAAYNSRFAIQDDLHDVLRDYLEPVLNIDTHSYWLTGRKATVDADVLNLGDLVDDSEEANAIRQKLAARVAKANRIFPLQVSIEDGLPPDIEDRIPAAEKAFRELFGQSTKISHHLNKNELTFIVKIDTSKLTT